MNPAPLQASCLLSPLKPTNCMDAYVDCLHSSLAISQPADMPCDLAFEAPSIIPIYDISGKLLKTIAANETPDWQCRACMKGFATKQSLERHKERHRLCAEWEDRNAAAPPVVIEESVYKWAIRTVEEVLGEFKDDAHSPGWQCKFCKKEFSNIGNLHKHFSNATTCNRLAYNAVREAFTTTQAAHT